MQDMKPPRGRKKLIGPKKKRVLRTASEKLKREQDNVLMHPEVPRANPDQLSKSLGIPVPVLGRPTLYSTEYPQLLVEHMRTGYSFESFAGKIGVSMQTIKDWCNQHTDFLAARQIGTAGELYWWEGLAIKNMFLTKDSEGASSNLNAALWRVNMQCRFPEGWNPKNHISLEGAIKADLEAVETLDPARVLELGQQALKYLQEEMGVIDITEVKK